ncbi:methyl-accepting chemotaxis protein [Rhodobacter sp. JA431]|uniref:methyl-accepting chemotaxis protein n=1 Tax=Rhodobacter sp. JA431 TaxID=570013 RepID=UPI000BC8F036|nr:methyl-accepting chemotaxis protein [Rhodobacter sp. JA431]SOB98330.1 methyl-accepting chemotaxis protein [Rhodobacter sp. JA431]
MIFRKRLSLGLKLPLMLVAIAMVALTVMGVSSYREARALLEEEASQRLERTLESRVQALEQWASQTQSELTSQAANPGMQRLVRDFTNGWKMLGEEAAQSLRASWVEGNPNPPQERWKLDFAGDINDFGIVHRRAHPGLVTLAQEKDLQDLYFVDVTGHVLYSLRKGDEFAANLNDPTQATGPLATTVAQAMADASGAAAVSDFVALSDGSRGIYLAQVMHSEQGVALGVLAFAARLDRVGAVMTMPRSLGDTGQAYLLDAQGQLQSPLRMPGGPEAGTVLSNTASAAVLGGETGRATYKGLTGKTVAGVYAPATLFGRAMGVVVEQDAAEVVAPARKLARKQLLNATWLIALLAGMSAWMARGIARPMHCVAQSVGRIAGGDHSITVPATERGDELGEIAKAVEGLRDDLAASHETRRAATIQGTAFQNSSAALMVVAPDLSICFANAALSKLVSQKIEDFRGRAPRLDPDLLMGVSLSQLYPMTPEIEARLADPSKLPFHQDVAVGEGRFGVDFSEIRAADGTLMGYVVEWRDVTELRMTRALLNALDSTQLMVEFSPDGRVTRGNDNILSALGESAEGLIGRDHAGLIEGEGDLAGFWSRLERLEPVIGRFVLQGANGCRVVAEGSVTPVPDREGAMLKIVLIGNDITQAQAALAEAQARAEAMLVGQRAVVEGLRVGLEHLARGDLKSRIETKFPEEYEQLRTDFNNAASTLADAMAVVIECAHSIDSEVSEINNAAADLSQRTEKQAGTLAETVTALDQLTSSVGAASAGISEADQMVERARAGAESSGQVVQQAVTAMGEISQSSEQISRIISVIEDIAFQTNLLALNAGVEAARAGEAGRGFAVVASEVRALAQRSSDAAREIDTLISTSSENVRRGVDLVGETGQALQGILVSVNEIAGRMSGIASSAREQSAGLSEINNAMIQLDQVTQQNAAMFEETTAAAQALSRGVQLLTTTTARFDADVPSAAKMAEPMLAPAPAPTPVSKPVAVPAKPVAKAVPSAKPKPAPAAAPVPRSAGALALKPEVSDWEDF